MSIFKKLKRAKNIFEHQKKMTLQLTALACDCDQLKRKGAWNVQRKINAGKYNAWYIKRM